MAIHIEIYFRRKSKKNPKNCLTAAEIKGMLKKIKTALNYIKMNCKKIIKFIFKGSELL